eukprot:3730514-Rhodomonas_salina.2
MAAAVNQLAFGVAVGTEVGEGGGGALGVTALRGAIAQRIANASGVGEDDAGRWLLQRRRACPTPP